MIPAPRRHPCPSAAYNIWKNFSLTHNVLFVILTPRTRKKTSSLPYIHRRTCSREFKNIGMEYFSRESEEASIVLVGSFNPAIFHPEWFVSHELIPQDDIKDANVEIVHQDLSKFSLQWLGIDVLRNKFIARTHDPSNFSALKDLMFSVFKILYHTPISQLGMNLITIYRIDTEEIWHKIGDTLVPKNIWEESLPKRIGMTSVAVQSPRQDSLDGFIRVIVSSVRSEFYGVSFNINSHVELNAKQHKETKYELTEIIAQYWEPALRVAREISERILRKAIDT